MFDRIGTAGLKWFEVTLPYKKSYFSPNVVSYERIKTDSERVKAVKTKPVPMNVKQLQSFPGLASYNS